MAKKSKIAREHKVIKNVQKYAVLRAELKDIIKSPKSSFEDKKAAVAKLDRLPKTSAILELELGVLKLVDLEV